MENFKDIIDKFVIKFSESTKDAFDKKRLTEAFEKYLYKQVEAEEKINQNFNIDDKSDMESLLKYVTDDVIKLPLEQKRQISKKIRFQIKNVSSKLTHRKMWR